MKLNCRQYGEGDPLIIMHGLFGMLDNWTTLAKMWAKDFHVVTVDMRNHGHSDRSDILNYDVMMDDIRELMDELHLPHVSLLGHSMGGKVAMKLAQNYPQDIERLIVADIGPKNYPVHHRDILDTLCSMNLEEIKTRKQAQDFLTERMRNEGVVLFFLKNLYWNDDKKLEWRFNLKVIEDHIEKVGIAIEDQIYRGRTLFLRGDLSPYILDDDWPEIQVIFPDSELITVHDAGHWLHAEKRQEFYEAVYQFLKS
ncbi:MAG TPA: alpha/beta hydrolase [Flavobacteriales bacterium]|jgi:esterase|nr:alpha/beta hydrolase [Flavobacteriales bacterium]